jgi:UDP-N-acetylmuramate--alanine ligase
MIGIGGIGMSALAKLLLARGVSVSGSDALASPLTQELTSLGAAVTIGHEAPAVDGAARVVISDAIHADNPELRRARELDLPVIRRSKLLAELMAERRGIAVSGTHGKTTVTAMIGLILMEAGLEPTVVLGGEYEAFGGNALAGTGEWMVVEACEAYESYLDLAPEIAVITNIEADHLDHHKTEAHLRESFREFLGNIRPGGSAVLCADREELKALGTAGGRTVVTYGLAAGADVCGEKADVSGSSGACRLVINGADRGELRVPVPGMHNLVNALGATAAALRAGATVDACRAALAKFAGVGRRFELLGEAGSVTIIDDYAHHPTEITATLAAARSAYPGRRLVAVFQPHLYSRTRDFADGFVGALELADVVVMIDIYPAREDPIPGVTSEIIGGPLRERKGKDAVFELSKDEIPVKLPRVTRSGDVVLLMGAGDIGDKAREFAARLGARFEGWRPPTPAK